MVNITIDNHTIAVPSGTTIMEAAASIHIPIPKLCYLKDINEIGACRVCVVEIEGQDHLVTSCNNVVEEGMTIYTNSPKVRRNRKHTVEMILSQHDAQCATCVRSGNCTLQTVANDLNIVDSPYKKEICIEEWDTRYPLVRDASKCVKCMRCIQVCDKIQGMHIWDVSGTGARTTVGVSENRDIKTADCALCGQCITHCPTGALRERDDTDKLYRALEDKDTIVVAQIAPAVRAAWGESLGLSREEATVEKIVDALRRIGVDYVFDTTWAADLTIMEEANEFVNRLTKGGDLPIMTSCCPAWVNFCETQYPDLLKYLSTCRSPQSMFSPVARYYFADKVLGKKADEVIVMSIMPCIAKKYEVAREELGKDGIIDTDLSLTVRELARMIREAGIDLATIEDAEFDSPLGYSTGAADIFGVTGGVLEAALRTAYTDVTKVELPDDAIEFKSVRGFEGIKEATVNVGGTDVNVVAASSLGCARKLMDELRADIAAGRAPKYHIIEIMACPGGCVAGGGQPFHGGDYEKVKARGAGLYAIDANKPKRKSHQNEDIKKLYAEFLGERGGHNAHTYLHTHYFDRSNPYAKKTEAECTAE